MCVEVELSVREADWEGVIIALRLPVALDVEVRAELAQQTTHAGVFDQPPAPSQR